MLSHKRLQISSTSCASFPTSHSFDFFTNMFTLNDDDVRTIRHIISLSVSSGANHGKEAQHIIWLPQTVSLPGTSATTSTATSEISNEGSSELDHESLERLRSRLKKLENDLVEVTQGFSKVSYVTEDVRVLFKSLEYRAYMLQSVCRDILLAPGGNAIFPADKVNASVQGVAEIVSKLKSEIPSTGILRVQNVSDLLNHLVKMPTYQEYQGCLALQNFEKNYKSLNQRLQQCLFCFSAFPEGSIVDKTLLMYWWIGESLMDPEINADKIVEEIANKIVKQFVEFQFVEPVTENGKLVGLRMPPIIRYAVAYFAERANFFDFDFEWNPTSEFGLCHRACLMETPDGSSQQQLIEGARLHPEKLKTLFNVNKRIVDISGKWFQKIRNVSVLFLEVWDKPFERVFELRGRKSLKWLKSMKHLRFLGLAGFAGLQGLATSSDFLRGIGKLENLRILTLRDWKELYELPKGLMSLRRLTHLELNEQGRWNLLPKVIEQLAQLQVLKGFVIPGYQGRYFATLDDLARLKKLRKLSIVVSAENFLEAEDFEALCHITSLRKLTILWNFDGPLTWREEERFPEIPKLPMGLRKLDLRNFPKARASDLPKSLESLQKLYIRGGNLHDLPKEDQWNVKILRLIDLPKFRMDWRRVQDEFPDLIYLEINECPKLTSFPCDANGVWINKEKMTEKLLEELGFGWSFLPTYRADKQLV